MKHIILKELREVYGKQNIYCRILADELTVSIPKWDGKGEDSEREKMIMLRIWGIFPGGDTAEHAAHKIKMALFEAGKWN